MEARTPGPSTSPSRATAYSPSCSRRRCSGDSMLIWLIRSNWLIESSNHQSIQSNRIESVFQSAIDTLIWFDLIDLIRLSYHDYSINQILNQINLIESINQSISDNWLIRSDPYDLIWLIGSLFSLIIQHDIGQPDEVARYADLFDPVEVPRVPFEELVIPFLVEPHIDGEHLVLLVL